MTKDGNPEGSGADAVEVIAVAADAARLEAERLTAERIASATLTIPPSTGNVSVDLEDPKLFTSSDLVQALEKQKRDMEAEFAKMKASASETQTSSGAAPRPPQAAFVYPGSELPLQRGGPYQWDYPTPKLVEPKYNFNGNPPVLTETTNFLDWKSLMADYLRFVCEPMWNLIDSGKGYYPVDPNNLTPSEVFDRHLNLAAIGFLKRGMDELTRAPFLHITNAKELWDTLLIAKSGTGSLQMTRYETAKNALHNLHMKKDETPQQLHMRLKVLAAHVHSFTCEKSKDGYQITNRYLVDKMLNALMVYSQQMVWELRRMPDFFTMTPDDVIATFLQYEEHLKESKRLLATYGGPSSNLALKAKLTQEDVDDEEDEYVYEDDEDSDGCPSYDDMALFVKRFTKGEFKGRFQKKKKRPCYNCDEVGHFAEACPYEKREDKPRFPRKEVAKKLPNPVNNKFKKKLGRAMVAQEESDPDDVGGVAGVAQDTQKTLKVLNKDGDVVHYNYMSDYTGNAHKCLMAKLVDDAPSSSGKIKVTPYDESFMLSSETPNDEFHDAEGDDANNACNDVLFDKVNKMMGTLNGKKLMMFQLLMDVVGKHTTTIDELETLLTEERENYTLLERKIDFEEARNDNLCKVVQTSNDLNDKHVASLKKANEICKELSNDMSKLVELNTSLSKDVEVLTLSLKTKDDELTTLKKNLETHKLAHIKTLTKMSPPTIVHVDACATNSTLDQASLIEENLALHAQLKKGLLTCAQGEKNLNDVLSHHKESFAKEGLGFDPSTSVTKDVTLSKGTTPQKVIFIREGHKDKGKKKVDEVGVVSGKATRGKPTPNKKKEKMPPSYVLRKAKDGDVYAKFIGPRNAFRFYAIWVPKTLVTNLRGPIAKWAPLTKA